ncbi:TPA: iron-containing redox enzyme family protein [Bacillus tropicus]|nr:iron-containing redox enzyme family protein [Bacillus tropicus]
MSHIYVQYPKLREGCEFTHNNNHIVLNYRGDQFELYPENSVNIKEILTLLNQLDGSKSIDELEVLNKKNGFDNTLKLIQVLDESCLLYEGLKKVFTGKSGLEFIMELEDLNRIWDRKLGETKLSRLFYEGESSKELVIGWAFEYYHITKRAHDCITPAIAKGHGILRKKLIEFLHEEYRHDKLLLKSLTSLGFTEQEVIDSIPTPYTAALSNALAKWAHTDLLTFMAVLFIMEGTDLDGEEYMNALTHYEIDENFIRYQGVHGDINLEGDHGNVSREFYSIIDYISEEDQLRVKKNLLMFQQMRVRQEEVFLDMYQENKRSHPYLFKNKVGI